MPEVHGRLIRRRRRELDLTQAQLASAIGVTATAVNRYERGKRPVDDRTKLAIATALATTATSLFPLDVDDLDGRFPPAVGASDQEGNACATDGENTTGAAADRGTDSPATDGGDRAKDGAKAVVA